MKDEENYLQSVPLKKRKIRMIGCRAVGLQFRGFIGHSTKGFVGDVSYRELNCDSLSNTSSEAMITARNLLSTLAIKYGFNPATCVGKSEGIIGHSHG
jgi:hypothetical protein